MILAGKDYGSGSSRDWAAKGPFLLGVKAVLAESYERIHRSNLVKYFLFFYYNLIHEISFIMDHACRHTSEIGRFSSS